MDCAGRSIGKTDINPIGYTIINSRTEGYCADAAWKDLLDKCLACANTYDMWKDYGKGVTAAAEGCGLTAVPVDNSASSSAPAPSTSAPAPSTSAPAPSSSQAQSSAPQSSAAQSSAAQTSKAQSSAAQSTKATAAPTTTAAGNGVSFLLQ